MSAGKFDGHLTDIFDLQDQIATNVVGAIEPTLRGAEIERAKRKRPNNLNGYDLYLRALPHAYAYTREGRSLAIELLAQALIIDPIMSRRTGSLPGAMCIDYLMNRRSLHPTGPQHSRTLKQ